MTIGFNTNKYGRVDYMTMDTKGIFRFYEIKVSKSDFHSKAKHTFLGHFNYYVLTEELFKEIKDEIPKHIGVYVLEKTEYSGEIMVCRKNPKKQKLGVDIKMLKDSMIRSLYREYEKSRKSENKLAMDNLQSRAQRLKTKNNKLNSENIKLRNMLSIIEMKYNIKAEDIEKEFLKNIGEL